MKVLHILSGLNYGGAESFIYNLLLAMETEDYQFDFLLRNENVTNRLILEKCQEKHYKIWITKSYLRHPLKNYSQVRKIISENEYDIIHVHANALIYIVPILIAGGRNKKIVLHSHSVANNKGEAVARMVHNINRFIIRNLEITNIACSEEAGKWMFKEKEFRIVHNAIDSRKYQYDADVVQRLRECNDLSKETVIGHAGRFVDVKNHEFIVKIFNEYLKYNPDSKLFLLGDGPLRKKIEEQCENLKISDRVIFKGNVCNVYEYLMIFDICLFPSKYEGFGFFVLEAQASGVPVLVSNNVNRECAITNLASFVSLERSANDWAKKLIEMLQEKRERTYYTRLVQTSQYDISALKKEMQEIYENYNQTNTNT